jgi:hypothetical protein
VEANAQALTERIRIILPHGRHPGSNGNGSIEFSRGKRIEEIEPNLALELRSGDVDVIIPDIVIRNPDIRRVGMATHAVGLYAKLELACLKVGIVTEG